MTRPRAPRGSRCLTTDHPNLLTAVPWQGEWGIGERHLIRRVLSGGLLLRGYFRHAIVALGDVQQDALS